MQNLILLILGCWAFIEGLRAMRQKRLSAWEWFNSLHGTPAVISGGVLTLIGIACILASLISGFVT